MYTTKQKGFTIVELLIVIVVIAILAAISIVAFTGIQQRGRDSERASDVSNIVKSLTAYTTDGKAWPESGSAAATALQGYDIAPIPESIGAKLGSTAASSSSSTTYGYTVCPSGATGTAITGATISWVKEAGGGTETEETEVGTGC